MWLPLWVAILCCQGIKDDCPEARGNQASDLTARKMLLKPVDPLIISWILMIFLDLRLCDSTKRKERKKTIKKTVWTPKLVKNTRGDDRSPRNYFQDPGNWLSPGCPSGVHRTLSCSNRGIFYLDWTAWQGTSQPDARFVLKQIKTKSPYPGRGPNERPTP